eukprot:TRINITY_DN28165_c0_g1_i1.p1 TRINITY_DN28165_c0_g1~~TRINITY_DN28165_c0_g1_i1.p1  ORF type:complete len:229 (+),score=-0.47 TRINITY_DN28165_c0_g1_i1:172-858(+)
MLVLYLLICLQWASGQTINWSGYTWYVRSGGGGPGPNNWSSSNVWIDANGWLHLKITSANNVWSCAEIWTTASLGFGTYQWQIEGRPDTLDKNVVLGLFPYGGTDGINEIDIEYAQWGDAAQPHGWWTVYPASGTNIVSHGFAFSLQGTYTTSRFQWNSTSVAYSLLGGHQPIGSNANLMNSWTYTPSAPTKVPQIAMPLHINLWLFQGKAPSNGSPVEIIIHSFTKA